MSYHRQKFAWNHNSPFGERIRAYQLSSPCKAIRAGGMFPFADHRVAGCWSAYWHLIPIPRIQAPVFRETTIRVKRESHGDRCRPRYWPFGAFFHAWSQSTSSRHR